VLLLDGRGLVLAGRLTGDAAGRAEEVGAVMGGTVEEVARAVAHLELNAWRGMLLECGDALLHVAPVRDDALLVLAARRDAPRGWVLRTAQRAVALAGPYLRSYV
jgi:predicted regulator of Ras-like GTPase activity (Roadblock/LC7/MglB family)